MGGIGAFDLVASGHWRGQARESVPYIQPASGYSCPDCSASRYPHWRTRGQFSDHKLTLRLGQTAKAAAKRDGWGLERVRESNRAKRVDCNVSDGGVNIIDINVFPSAYDLY